MLFHPALMSYPWMILVMISMAINLYYIVNRIVTFKRSKPDVDLNPILVWGAIASAFGMMGQTVGLWRAIQEIIIASDISPQIVRTGFDIAMVPAIWGFGALLISAVVYTVLRELSKR